jgi:hypothetical protein
VEEASTLLRGGAVYRGGGGIHEATSAQPGQMSGIEIRHRGGWSVIVEPGFDANHLRRLLAVLEMAS